MTGRYEISSERWAIIEAIAPLLNTWGGQGAMIVRCLTESSRFCARCQMAGSSRTFRALEDCLPAFQTMA